MYPPPWIQRTPGAGPSVSFGAKTLALIFPAGVAILTVWDVSVFPPPEIRESNNKSRVNSIFTKFFLR